MQKNNILMDVNEDKCMLGTGDGQGSHHKWPMGLCENFKESTDAQGNLVQVGSYINNKFNEES